MKLTFKHITDRLFSFSKVKKDEPIPEPAPSPDPPITMAEVFPSNVLRGTNPDLTLKTACQGQAAPETPAPAETTPVRQNRDCRVRICFTPEELADVKKKAQEAGLDCSKYIRNKVNAVELITSPVIDAAALTIRLRHVGYHIDTIRARANATGFIDVPELHKALDELSVALDTINAAYTNSEGSELK